MRIKPRGLLEKLAVEFVPSRSFSSHAGNPALGVLCDPGRRERSDAADGRPGQGRQGRYIRSVHDPPTSTKLPCCTASPRHPNHKAPPSTERQFLVSVPKHPADGAFERSASRAVLEACAAHARSPAHRLHLPRTNPVN